MKLSEKTQWVIVWIIALFGFTSCSYWLYAERQANLQENTLQTQQTLEFELAVEKLEADILSSLSPEDQKLFVIGGRFFYSYERIKQDVNSGSDFSPVNCVEALDDLFNKVPIYLDKNNEKVTAISEHRFVDLEGNPYREGSIFSAMESLQSGYCDDVLERMRMILQYQPADLSRAVRAKSEFKRREKELKEAICTTDYGC